MTALNLPNNPIRKTNKYADNRKYKLEDIMQSSVLQVCSFGHHKRVHALLRQTMVVSMIVSIGNHNTSFLTWASCTLTSRNSHITPSKLNFVIVLHTYFAMSNPIPASPPPAYSSLPNTRRSPSPPTSTEVLRRPPALSNTAHGIGSNSAQRSPLSRPHIPHATLRRAARNTQNIRRIRILPPPPVHVTGYKTILDELPLYSQDAPILSQEPREVTPPPYQAIPHKYEDNSLDNAEYRPNYWESEYFMRTGRVRGNPTQESNHYERIEAPLRLPPILTTEPGYISPQLLHRDSRPAGMARFDTVAVPPLEDMLQESLQRERTRSPSPLRPGSSRTQGLPQMVYEITQAEQVPSMATSVPLTSWRGSSADLMTDLGLESRVRTRSQSPPRAGGSGT
jgi:hypothetical protein